MARRNTASGASPHLISVYRHRNAVHVLHLVEETLQMGGTARLWALDEKHPQLARWTLGQGPGQRLALLNRLLADDDARPLVVADDDVLFVSEGGLQRFLAVAAKAKLDLAQPAHAEGSEFSHDVTRAVPTAVVRRTRFVEVGPLVLMSMRAQRALIPLPEELEMGWGLDIRWSRLAAQGYRLGIVDATPMLHLGPVAGAYDVESSKQILGRELERARIPSIEAMNHVIATWHDTGKDPLDQRVVWNRHLGAQLLPLKWKARHLIRPLKRLR